VRAALLEGSEIRLRGDFGRLKKIVDFLDLSFELVRSLSLAQL
jgi:hypothetical protein